MSAADRLRIPDHVRQRLFGVHGEAAARWFERLPAEVDRLAEEWGFELGEPFAYLSYAYVAPVRMSDGSEAVLKAQPPHTESRSGLPALAAWAGRGAVRLLAAEPGGSYELLERVRPGVMLRDSGLDDDEATRILVRSMPRLWVTPPNDPALITLRRWGRGLAAYVDAHAAGEGPLAHDLVVRARDTYAEMLATSPEPKLLHGDLHHGNLLSAQREAWLVIDPKGVVGDPAFEVSPLFFNPHPFVRSSADIPALVRRRYAIACEELDLDPHRIAAWGFARAVLSHCWSVEDAEPMEPHMLAVAEALWELI